MTDINKDILHHYMVLKPHSLWDDTMRRTVISAKYKESLKWQKSS